MRRGAAQLDSSDTIIAQISALTDMVKNMQKQRTIHEVKISQALNSRPMGGFPRDTEVAKGATHEQCKAISTRSGKILMTPNKDKQGEDTTANSKAAAVPDNPATADTPASTGEDHDLPI
ncbi:hypothetical protein V6N11_074173 [Hibiscus sabdariffa]|uniref:Uncharacterized protein n=1 Tax=Hibiscus sabdariffa TaxID=183260 RepID=A0ABR2NWJ7_9ROSI